MTPTPSPATFDVRGTLTLSLVRALGEEGETCAGNGGYSDIAPDAQVKVSDDAGKVIALGQLDQGITRKSSDWGYGGTNQCVFTFSVREVPAGSGSIYGVEVTHRGVTQFTRDQADQVALTLG